MFLTKVSHFKASCYGVSNENSSFVNPLVDYVEQTETIQ
jgi:hypothetical protein